MPITGILKKGTDTNLSFTEVMSRALQGKTTFGSALNQIRAEELKAQATEQGMDLAERQVALAEREFDFDQKRFRAETGNANQKAFEDRFGFWAKDLSKPDMAKLYDYAKNYDENVTADNADRVLSQGVTELGLRKPGSDAQDWKFTNVYADGKIHLGRTNERTGAIQIKKDGKWVVARGGRLIGKGGESEAGIASLLGDEFSLTPIPTEATADVEFSAATGATGFFGGIANTISDALGWGLQAPQVEVADSAIKKLMNQSNLVLAAEIPGRPSNYVRQRLAQLEIDTGSLLEGDARALVKLKELRDFMAEQHNQAVWVAGNAAFGADGQALAARNAKQLRQIVDELDVIQQRWVEHEAKIRGVGDEEEIEGVRVRRIK